ncbi:MAG: RNA methyltransferase [Leeuwenhoekiella sp.]
MHKEISSIQNPLVKKLVQLQEKSRERRKNQIFVIEGFREIKLALKAGYDVDQLLYCSKILAVADQRELFTFLPEDTEILSISQEVYTKIAYRNSTEGVIAVAKMRDHSLQNLDLPENPLLLIAEAPEKPGNIGALLRTADAAGVDAFIIANPLTDLYNPNIIRSSVGCVFTQKIAMASSTEVIEYLKKRKINIFTAILQDALPYQEIDFKDSAAIVVGTEADGLTDEWRENSTQNIIIPMQGKIDSMNVSVAAAILIFEARRQRGFKS